MSNEIDEKLFQQIFGHTLIKLADKLINTTDKEENQIIVKNIEKNKDKLFKEDEFYNFVIQPSDWGINLIDSINLILDFNETIQLDIILTDKTLKLKSQEDENKKENNKNENENENENGNENRNENESKKENDNNKNVKNKKTSTNTKNKDENKNILVEYMGEIDDKLFRKYSKGKNFSSFINDFDRATNKEDKEKLIKELKKIQKHVDSNIETDENSEYINELIDIDDAINYFLNGHSKKWVSDF